MRLLSLTVRDFRAVAEARIEPLGTGVTIVQGPNEAGKSSLVDALDLLFTRRDDTTAAEVRDAQPIGRDVGPEVAVEAEAGGYRFRYRKRFLKDRETVLEVERPAVERLTGREAHERMDEILDEVLDRELWRALRLRQGDDALQPGGLAGARSLLGALGGARVGEADGAPRGPGGAELLDLARAQRRRYFTPARGDATGELATAREELGIAEEEAGRLEREMAALETDAERAGRLQRRIAEVTSEVEAAAERHRASRTELEGISRLEAEVQARQGESAEARELERALAELVTAEEAERELAGRLRAARAEESQAAEALEPAVRDLAAASAAAEEARARAERLRGAVRLGERRAAVAEMAARRDRAVEAARRVADGAKALAALPVDDAALDDLAERSREADRLAATLAAASPEVTVTAEQATTVEIDAGDGGTADGDRSTVALGPGERRSWRPGAPWRLRLPGIARLEVAPGADAVEAARRLTEVRGAISARCRELGVDDLAAARRAHRGRRDAQAELDTARAVLAETLAGRELADLEAAVTAAEVEVERLAREADSAGGAADEADQGVDAADSPSGAEDLAGSLDAVEREGRTRAAEAKAAAEAKDRLEGAHRRAAEIVRSLSVQGRDAAERQGRAARRVAEIAGPDGAAPGLFGSGPAAGGQDLSRSEGTAPSDVSPGAAAAPEEAPGAPQLDLFMGSAGAEAYPSPVPAATAGSPAAPVERLAAARRALVAAEERTAAARRRLTEARPEEIRRRAAAAAEDERRTRAELRSSQDERIEVVARLDAAGDRELYAELGRASARREAARAAAAAVEARAAAADRLVRALETAREEVRARFSEPLRRTIVELGEPLFGPGFDVELDGELAIARRTAGGLVLPFDRLSAGAKEQLGLLTRLACAVLVAPAGGVPVILDDALGSSDEERLRAVGRALSLAGRRCQILVLTCFPSRYRHVEGARVVEMDPGPAGGRGDGRATGQNGSHRADPQP